MRSDDRHRQEAPEDPLKFIKVAIRTGVMIGFVGLVIYMAGPAIKRDFLPWMRDPVRVAVAEGWADRLPAIPDGGACRPETAKPPGKLSRRADTDVYETPSRGEIHVECEGRKLILDVRRVARITVVAPERLKVGETASARMQAYDFGGEVLRIGELGRVAWRVEGPLVADSEGSPAASTRIRASGVGEASVVAEFDKLTGRMKIRIE